MLRVAEDVVVRNVCFIQELTVLSFFLPTAEKAGLPLSSAAKDLGV